MRNLVLGIVLLVALGCTPTRSAKELKEARIKSIVQDAREAQIYTFIREPAPGLRLACVTAVRSGGLWCTRREAGETW